MDATDTKTPNEIYVENLIENSKAKLQSMFPHFKMTGSFDCNHIKNMLHLKGEATTMSMPLSNVVTYLEGENEKEKS